MRARSGPRASGEETLDGHLLTKVARETFMVIYKWSMSDQAPGTAPFLRAPAPGAPRRIGNARCALSSPCTPSTIHGSTKLILLVLRLVIS